MRGTVDFVRRREVVPPFPAGSESAMSRSPTAPRMQG